MRPRQAAMEDFRTHYIAHRGLFDNSEDYPENTLTAFTRAVEHGFGVELDVHLTKDGQLVVAHDDGLRRICGEDIDIADLTYEELATRRVFGSSQKIPLFTEVLAIIGGRVPLVVEIKPARDNTETCRVTDGFLRHYRGRYCVESFDPRVLMWFRRHHRGVLRGQLSDDFFKSGEGSGNQMLDRVLANMFFSPLTWPDFIAYNWQHADRFAVGFWHMALRCTMVAWTIQSKADLDIARERFNAFIFDSFVPADRL